jgi:hypothetical protein
MKTHLILLLICISIAKTYSQEKENQYFIGFGANLYGNIFFKDCRSLYYPDLCKNGDLRFLPLFIRKTKKKNLIEYSISKFKTDFGLQRKDNTALENQEEKWNFEIKRTRIINFLKKKSDKFYFGLGIS